MNMLWTEKYRPTKLHQIIGQTNFTLDAQEWKAESNMPNVLIYGNSGNGKTTAGIVLAREILGDNFKQAAQSGTIGDVPFRICLLDELEGMTTDAQNALKRIMERYASNIRFIITCNDRNKIIFALQSRCANYHFKPLNNDDMMTVLKSILEQEKISHFKDEDLGGFIYSMQGDMRRAITELQAAKSSNTTLRKQVTISLEDYEKILNKIINKNTNVLGDIHELLYQGRTVKEICNGLHDVVINSEGLDSNVKFKLLRTIGESEWRSNTMTPKELISWMMGQLL